MSRFTNFHELHFFKKKASIVNFSHDLLHISLQVNQTKFFTGITPTDGMISSCCSIRGAVHSGKKWRSVLWLNAMHSGIKTAMHSGKKWWIREFVLPFTYSFKILIMLLLARYARSAAISLPSSGTYVLIIAPPPPKKL